MRKITKESAKAFVNFEPFKKSNTEVVAVTYKDTTLTGYDKDSVQFKTSLLKLHGNQIACFSITASQHNKNVLVENLPKDQKSKHPDFTEITLDLCDWHTPTTRERINGVLDALGYDFKIAQRKGEQVLVRKMRRPKFVVDGEKVLILSEDRFDPDFAKRVFGSCHFVSGTDLQAIQNF